MYGGQAVGENGPGDIQNHSVNKRISMMLEKGCHRAY